MNHVSESGNLPEMANVLEAFLKSRVAELSEAIASLEADTILINALDLLSEDKEREQALSESRFTLSQAERLLETLRKTSGFAGLRAPLTRFRQCQVVKQNCSYLYAGYSPR
ncbi:hypothetical protein ACFDWB_005165 [Salmonella enterica]|nr:hypothetical protein [Salmonella enterica]EKO0906703.1 hypothetical protein [Salmonella enterica subsp. enterica]EGA2426444.1 hypothetical protein [Salmonella enterica]EGD2776747.1 hypothetical protein [Salmonella enterica]EGG5218382.1 hypothetical protein [Salmonella enterica]